MGAKAFPFSMRISLRDIPFLESLENKPGVGLSPVTGFFTLELLLEHEEITNKIKKNLTTCFIIINSNLIIYIINHSYKILHL